MYLYRYEIDYKNVVPIEGTMKHDEKTRSKAQDESNESIITIQKPIKINWTNLLKGIILLKTRPNLSILFKH